MMRSDGSALFVTDAPHNTDYTIVRERIFVSLKPEYQSGAQILKLRRDRRLT